MHQQFTLPPTKSCGLLCAQYMYATYCKTNYISQAVKITLHIFKSHFVPGSVKLLHHSKEEKGRLQA
jgi:hypothetical protein